MTVVNFAVAAGVKRFLTDFTPSSERAATRFRFWHVERLLNQAADLLDRCLAEQARYDALHAQGFTWDLTLRAEDEQLVIEEEKIAARLHESDLRDAELKAAVANNVRRPHGQAMQQLGELDRINQTVNVNGPADVKLRTIADLRLGEMEEMRLQLDQDLLAREIDRGSGPLGTKLQERMVREARVRLVEKRNGSQNGGPLDYHAQADRSLQRITRDYQDAVDRLLVASDGLKRIYGYDDPFADRLQIVASGTPDSVDDAVLWVREAIRFLAGFGQNDQTVTLTISLAQAMGSAFSQLQAGQKTAFRLDPALLAGLRYVRLRGLSACLRTRSGSAASPVRCIVRVPRAGQFIFEGPVRADIIEAMDQSMMPPCVLGNVFDERLPREPEICGAISLMNASPIGDESNEGAWTITIASITGAALTDVDDVLLDVRVTAQPSQS